MSSKDVDIRKCSFKDRQMLATGQRVVICQGEQPIAEMPRPLFIATSTNAGKLEEGLVKLPEDVDPRGVLVLMSTYDMLSVTAAADVLGMKKYTDHIYRKCEACLRHELPSYEDLNAFTLFAAKHSHLLRLLVSTAIAKREEYVANCARIGQEREDKNRAALQAKIAEERATAIDKEREQRQKEKAAKEKEFWDKKKAEAAEDEKAIQAKLKLSADKRKFTPREKAHWRRTRGTKLPKGC
ncbi:hypothetical protein EK21DRAFT_100301 [Setomelanomma holmii]|uniref:Uncharacterized protein n=1 Tax=Setomelanomma holmii TaxID=210430 RepID=A0A9P4H9L9_9PLEO|nr:hypothetical protein EK21DRAFT_100301 [Setomelanomma holmii]